MDIRRIDLHDDALAEVYTAFDTAERHGRPHPTSLSTEEFVAMAMARSEDPDEKMVPLAAYDPAGVVAGAAIAFIPLLDNLEKFYFVLAVAPERRRQGIGSALLDHLVAVAGEEGRTALLGESRLPLDAEGDHPYALFAARHGFTRANVELERVLPLPVPEARLDAWSEQAAAHHEGYRIQSYLGLVPEHLRASLVAMKNQLAVDAPTGEIEFEEQSQTVAVYEDHMRQHAERGREMFETIAVWVDTDGTEQTVAQTTLGCPPGKDDMPNLHQWGTFVDRAHRGHRLGLAVKAANLRQVQRAHPERTVVHTQNSPENGPMVAVNERLGFRPVEAAVEYLRTR